MALILVDVQHGFISRYTRRALPHIERVLETCQFRTIIATQFVNPPGSPFHQLVDWHAMTGGHEVELHPAVARRADTVVRKTTYGAARELAAELKDRDLKQAVLMGIDTDVCVLQNAAGLFDLGFDPYVDMRGCATGGGLAADRAAVSLMCRTVGAGQVIER